MHRESIYKHFVPLNSELSANSSRVAQTAVTGQPAFWFAFSSSRLLVKEQSGQFSLLWHKRLEDLNLKPLRTQYLGQFKGQPCFSAELPPEISAPEGLAFTDMRTFYFGVEEDIFLLAGRALQIMTWDQTHQFCGRCGQPTETLAGEMAKICPACKFTSYPRISPAIIVAVIKENKILLTRYASVRGRWHTIIAGFLEPGETLEECVQREVLEEVGLHVKNIRYFGNQPWPFPNSLMIGFTAEYQSGEIKVDGKEIGEADWYLATDIPEVPPKMSISREIIDWFRDSPTAPQ
jgi:NAD+ diphosphatase